MDQCTRGMSLLLEGCGVQGSAWSRSDLEDSKLARACGQRFIL